MNSGPSRKSDGPFSFTCQQSGEAPSENVNSHDPGSADDGSPVDQCTGPAKHQCTDYQIDRQVSVSGQPCRWRRTGKNHRETTCDQRDGNDDPEGVVGEKAGITRRGQREGPCRTTERAWQTGGHLDQTGLRKYFGSAANYVGSDREGQASANSEKKAGAVV